MYDDCESEGGQITVETFCLNDSFPNIHPQKNVFTAYVPLQLCFDWNNSFLEGWQDVEDDKRLGPSLTRKTDKGVEEVSFMKENTAV
jgi:hypothetical protein